jgi:hypothetical protein
MPFEPADLGRLGDVHRVVIEHLPVLIGQVESILGRRALEL